MTFDKIINSVKNREFSPVYLLHGEEGFFIDRILENIQNEALTELEKEFNQNVFYGKDVDPKQLIGACLQYPMMSQHRLIILKEAQSIKDIESLLPVVENPAASTILVIAHKEKKIAQKSKTLKAASVNGVVFESNKLYENKIPDWIKSYAGSSGIRISDKAAGLVATLLSNDLTRIDNELQKLMISCDTGKTIDVEQVRSNISLSREFTIFELSKAVGEKNISKAIKILEIFENNPTQYPNTLIISTLFGYFTKVMLCAENMKKSNVELGKLLGVHSFFVDEYKRSVKIFPREKLHSVISLLKEYDLKSKGLDSRNTPQLELIKEMIIRIAI